MEGFSASEPLFAVMGTYPLSPELLLDFSHHLPVYLMFIEQSLYAKSCNCPGLYKTVKVSVFALLRCEKGEKPGTQKPQEEEQSSLPVGINLADIM